MPTTEQEIDMENSAATTEDGTIVEYDITDATIAELRDQGRSLDISADGGYEAVRKFIRGVVTLRTTVEAKRKELKADALAWGRKVDAEAKRITNLLLEIEEPLKLAKKEVDDERERIKAEKAAAEKARIDAHKARIQEYLEAPINLARATSDDIEAEISRLEGVEIQSDAWEEFFDEAQQVLSRTIDSLKDMHTDALMREAVERRNAERERELEEERKRFEAEQAEQNRIAAEKRAEEEARLQQQRDEQEAEKRRIKEERAALEAEKAEQRHLEELRAAEDAEPQKTAEQPKGEVESTETDGEAETHGLEISRSDDVVILTHGYEAVSFEAEHWPAIRAQVDAIVEQINAETEDAA